ncbi:MAG: carbon starvation protein A, partial [Planctomycetota bacterium]
MNALVIVVLSFAVFFLAQRFYARWLERRVYETDSDEPTPAHTKADGVDFVACSRHVLFGHHFCSIAGAAPIVGPAIAVIWGWVPALLWIVFGTTLIGAVHDFGALAMSAKRGGRTIGDIAGQLLGPRARVYFLLVLILLTWIIIAVFAFVVGVLFWKFPQSVWPVNFEIVVALAIGWWIYKRHGKLLWPSLIAVTLLYVAVFICASHPEWGTLPPSLRIAGSSVVTWIVFLLAYSFIASVLPVRVLLQPRDYINSHQLFIGLAVLVAGVVWLRPEITAPAFGPNLGDTAPLIVPFLFITIACGAISGFHGLVSSGTTSKQLDRMRDARHVGYGGMLGEGTLAVLALIAVTAGLGSAAEWHARYADWKMVATHGIANFVDGPGNLVRPIVLGDLALAKRIVAGIGI